VNEEPQQPTPETDPLLAPLNEHQRATVLHGDGPLLVLAGAGSGKTRAITHRIAWLVERRNVTPWRILAVTFTNKAAGEMRERLEKLLGAAGAEVHVSTFHSTGAAILRREAEKVGLTRSFVIYDDTDQMQLIRRALQESGVGEKIRAQTVRHRIDQAKNNALGPDAMVVGSHDFVGIGGKKAYVRYQQLLRAADAVDFGDLLLKPVELFRNDKLTLERYRQRFRYVLVDEFQDTNAAQYELLRLLCPPGQSNLCVVGDDDQSIYRWRGADPSNILSFDRHYPGTAVVRLERNYRSDAGILDAAYAVISKNTRRKEKRLWTDRPRGEPLSLLFAPDERSEAQQIAARVRGLAADGMPYSEIAVFYRVNSQSRVLEEALRLATIPYHVVRGRAFYDRAEIKDAASYLRLAVNPRSDADIERVINRPTRGIGDTTVERLRAHARAREASLFEALGEAEVIESLNSAARRRLSSFRELLEKLAAEAAKATTAREAVDRMLALSGMEKAVVEEGSEEALERVENLRELSGAAGEFDRLRAEEADETPPPSDDPEAGPLHPPLAPLEAFLEQISLIGDADAEDGHGRVSLMTLHAAKGLEFDAVFMSGMEEGVFPHARASQGEEGMLADPEEMAEERRRCYVGITRARRRLCFSLAQSRALMGELRFNPPSRFLSDIPRELFGMPAAPGPVKEAAPPKGELYVEREETFELDATDGFEYDELDQRSEYELRARRETRRQAPVAPTRRRAAGGAVPAVGMRVRHEQFGEGLVVGGGGGPNPTLTVRFPGLGERRIVARFLTPVD